MNGESLEELRGALVEQYPATAETAWRNVTMWLDGERQFVPMAALEEFVQNAPVDLLHDCFWRNIPFGTGGVRGPVGFGPNRINPTVVALTIQAHCDFVNEFLSSDGGAGYERCVVVANDVRLFLDSTRTLKFMSTNPYHADNDDYGVTSRRLARLAAGIYAANGVTVYLMEPENDAAVLTTPELSYLIRQLHASGGINMSASHNPPDDNGVKVYDENGGQYLPPNDQRLTDKAREMHEVRHMGFAEAVAEGLVRDIPADLVASYMSMYVDRAHQRGLQSEAGTSVVFTPLNGCGERTVGKALTTLGYAVHVPEGQGPDGTFKLIPLNSPNPEVKEATEPSKAAAEKIGARIVIASDPDADRAGAEVFHDGAWVHLTGNQIAQILAYYMLLDPQGPQLRGGVYQSIVTTLATREIAERAGISPDAIVTDLLVGFKYVGRAVRDYAKRIGDADDTALLAFAAEESHGYLDTPQLRDKDAMAGALYLAKLHERLTGQGRTLLDYLRSVYEDVGEFGDRGRSITILGSRGVREIQRIMEVLRETKPMDLGGLDVQEYIDHWDEKFGKIDGPTDNEARNILVFRFDGGQVTFRPSGTEPKIKFYVQTRPPAGGWGAQDIADRLSDKVYLHVLGIIGQELHPAFVALPDVIPLNSKVAVQETVETDLRRMLGENDQTAGFLAGWLDERLAASIQGQSSWEIAVPAIRAAVTDWTPEERERLEAVLTSRGK